MRTRMLAGFVPAALLLSAAVARAAGDPDTVAMRHDPLKYQIVVSATKTTKDAADVPNGTAVVRGDELRRRGTRTLAEALQDVVGLDTGEGSDNGARLPNMGLWGLKEFDALLVTVDGVPLGGPFNPSLSQIPIEEIDRIEVVKGPQGTLYGVSAFAGMVQVFTRQDSGNQGHFQLGGGSYNETRGSGDVRLAVPRGGTLRLSGLLQKADGWQERTGSDIQRGTAALTRDFGDSQFGLSVSGYYDSQKWGTPMPVDAGLPVPGFELDHNYAVRGARLDHHATIANSSFKKPLGQDKKFENTLGFAYDRQTQIRSFPDPGAASGDTVPSAGVMLKPIETTLYEDARLVFPLELAGKHQWVAGAALTWGKTTADGMGFDFDQQLGDPNSIPEFSTIPVGDIRSFWDHRTFVGVYAHDEYAVHERVTLSGGIRYDATSEKLHAQAQEQVPGSPLEVADDSRSDSDWSGDVGALVRLLPQETKSLNAANLYANWKRGFKPAAPNLTEAEGAEILQPERSNSWEVGLKSRVFERQLAFDVSYFDMKFENMVVSNLDTLGNPVLENAGKERFKGAEVGLEYVPDWAKGTTLHLGYAHHDARFVEYTFVTPDGQLRDVAGKRLELVPADMVNAKLDYVHPGGAGLFGAVRWQGERPLTRRNTFWADAYTEYDAGVTYRRVGWAASIVGRNLGDDRHYTSESDLGDSMFYVAPPRRFEATVGYSF
jgi:iron complex outermembrane receptor protein